MAPYTCTAVLICGLAAIFIASAQDENNLAVVQGNNNFGAQWYQIQSRESGNIFISPYSAHTILLLLAMGAESTTFSTMAKGLQVPEDKDIIASGAQHLITLIREAGQENITLKTANRIYIDTSFKITENYKRIAEGPFFSDIVSTNFCTDPEKSRVSINQWVEDQTNNRIQNLLTPGTVGPGTRSVLVNTIYFKGNWSKKFNSENTRSERFHLSCNNGKNVEMMYTTDYYLLAEFPDYQALQLDYQGNKLQMLILLPRTCDDGTSLNKLIQNVNFTHIQRSMIYSEVHVYIPKFKVEKTIQMTTNLVEMGMGEIFSDEANFSGISSNEALKVSSIVQKTFVEVSEEGTEAAAATAIGLAGITSEGNFPPPLVFRADRPFLYFIMEKSSQAVLFLGRFSG